MARNWRITHPNSWLRKHIFINSFIVPLRTIVNAFLSTLTLGFVLAWRSKLLEGVEHLSYNTSSAIKGVHTILGIRYLSAPIKNMETIERPEYNSQSHKKDEIISSPSHEVGQRR
jgi:hypothetical protein